MSVAVLEHVGTCWNTRSSSGRECFAICKYGQVTHAWRKYSGSRCRICSHGIEVLLEPSNHRARKVPWKYKRTQVVLLLVSQICIEQCVSMWVRKGGMTQEFWARLMCLFQSGPPRQVRLPGQFFKNKHNNSADHRIASQKMDPGLQRVPWKQDCTAGRPCN